MNISHGYLRKQFMIGRTNLLYLCVINLNWMMQRKMFFIKVNNIVKICGDLHLESWLCAFSLCLLLSDELKLELIELDTIYIKISYQNPWLRKRSTNYKLDAKHIERQSRKLQLEKGCKKRHTQENVIFTLRSTMIVNKMLFYLNEEGSKIVAYVDDIVE